MQLQENEISVFLANCNKEHPYKAGMTDSLCHGLYCETVIGTNSSLLVADTLADDYWKTNPDIKLGMVSYLGFPINWTDGEFFGTMMS